jgi:excisionase family DNA binding protein
VENISLTALEIVKSMINPADMFVILTIPEAAALMGLSEFTVRSLCKSGTIPYVADGKKFLINKAVLIICMLGQVAS